jgi:RNA polymerase sigma-70 factor (ECF subfamily)
MPTTRMDPESGDDNWFDSLYSQTFEKVVHFARKLVRDQVVAEDIVAETYMRVWRARSSFSGQGSAESWPLAITHNCAMSYLRSRRAEVSLDVFYSIGDPEAPEVSDPPTMEIDSETLERALEELTAKQRGVILFRYYEGLPHEEIARRLGMSATATRQVQVRALLRLRGLLQGEVPALRSPAATGRGRACTNAPSRRIALGLECGTSHAAVRRRIRGERRGRGAARWPGRC